MKVRGIKWRASQLNTEQVDHLCQDLHGDLTDATHLIRIVQAVQLEEIYNLPRRATLSAAPLR